MNTGAQTGAENTMQAQQQNLASFSDVMFTNPQSTATKTILDLGMSNNSLTMIASHNNHTAKGAQA